MIVLGLIGRPDEPECHDAAACLLIDGRVVGAIEQERLSRRRHAPGEGPEPAARVLLARHGIAPAEVDAIGYAWAPEPLDVAAPRDYVERECTATSAFTETILPTLGPQLQQREIAFFDHHRCHAAHAYFLNAHPQAAILVVDGWGGDGSTSLYRAAGGELTLLERYRAHASLGVFYESAAYYAGLGWDAPGKLMGLSSYGTSSGQRFISFDPAAGAFETAAGGPVNSAPEWLELFERSAFPYRCAAPGVFDYLTFAADAQATVEDCALGLVERLCRLCDGRTLLLGGGVALNAQMNRKLVAAGTHDVVSSTVAPNDAGAAIGAAFLAEQAFGAGPSILPPGGAPPIFLGPPLDAADIEAAVRAAGVAATTPSDIAADTAQALERGEIVAWFEGASEFGPRALGARSLLASPARRESLDRLNAIKGRAPWRPSALSLLPSGFDALGIEPPVAGLTEYMLCTHAVGREHEASVLAGVHVDHTTRAQCVGAEQGIFAALLAALERSTGAAAVVNTSLNTGGRPMVFTPLDALTLWQQTPDVERLVLPPYVVTRR